VESPTRSSHRRCRVTDEVESPTVSTHRRGRVTGEVESPVMSSHRRGRVTDEVESPTMSSHRRGRGTDEVEAPTMSSIFAMDILPSFSAVDASNIGMHCNKTCTSTTTSTSTSTSTSTRRAREAGAVCRSSGDWVGHWHKRCIDWRKHCERDRNRDCWCSKLSDFRNRDRFRSRRLSFLSAQSLGSCLAGRTACVGLVFPRWDDGVGSLTKF
jgi:hypothetical protein